MKFINYEEVIRNNHQLLIDSFVEQYGEEHREHITDVFKRLKYCFFVTPSTLREYVDERKKRGYIYAIIDTLVDIGCPLDKIKIKNEKIVVEDEKIDNFVKTLFIDDEKIKHGNDGIWVFDSDDVKKQKSILKELGLKGDFLKYREFFKKVLDDFKLRVLEQEMFNPEKYLEYASRLEKEMMAIYEELGVIQEKVKKEIDEDIYIDSYDSPSGYLVEENIPHKNLLVFFRPEFTRQLEDSNISTTWKEGICRARYSYLKSVGYEKDEGININPDNELCFGKNIYFGEKYYKNWYDIDRFKKYLPDEKIVTYLYCYQIEDNVKDFADMLVADICIINDYQVNPYDNIITNVVGFQAHTVQIDEENINHEKPQFIICLLPLTADYDMFDLSIDHEHRHAVETYLRKEDDPYIAMIQKIGSSRIFLSKKGNVLYHDFSDYNERVTEKLSLESCRKRWRNKQFIFSGRYAQIDESTTGSIYMRDLGNLDIVFEPFREKLIAAQISSDEECIFGVIPKPLLELVDKNITKHDFTSLKVLCDVRDQLLQEKASSNKAKQKNFNKEEGV